MQAILIPMIRKNDDDVLNVCNPGIITSVFDLLVSLPLWLYLLAILFIF